MKRKEKKRNGWRPYIAYLFIVPLLSPLQQVYFLNPVLEARLMRVVGFIDFLDHSDVYARADQSCFAIDSKGKAKLKKERKEKRKRSTLHRTLQPRITNLSPSVSTHFAFEKKIIQLETEFL